MRGLRRPRYGATRETARREARSRPHDPQPRIQAAFARRLHAVGPDVGRAKRAPPARVRHHFPRDSVTLNGNRYGFQTAYNTGIDNLFFINCNSADIMNGYSIADFARALEDICFDLPKPNFSIGIAFGINENDQLYAYEVLPGTPADRAGLKQGDLLLAANGVRFDIADPLETIRSSIDEGETLRLRVRRDGKLMTLTIEPTPTDP